MTFAIFMRRVLLTLSLMLSLPLLLQAKMTEKVSLQLQWKHQFEYAGFYAAIDKGFYEEEGLVVELREMRPGLDPVEEVIEGRADLGIAYSSLIEAYLQGKPVVLLANIFKHSALVILSQKELTLPSDLKGKRVMGSPEELRSWGLAMMFKRFGMSSEDVELIRDVHTLDAFINRDVDAMTAFISNETYQLDLQDVKYTIHNPSNYGAQFYDINLFTSKSVVESNREQVQAFRIASLKGWEYALKHSDEIIDLILQKYNTQSKSREALEYEAEMTKRLILPQVYEVGSIDPHIIKEMARYLMDVGILPNDTEVEIRDFLLEAPLEVVGSPGLTVAEKKYLAEKEEIKLCVGPNWMPFEAIEEGKHVGMSADYMRIIEKKIDLPMILVPTKNWVESLESVKDRKCDILPLIMQTPERSKYLGFTRPYLNLPNVIATTTDKLFIPDIAEVLDKRFGMVRGYAIAESLKRQYPSLNIIEVDSIEVGLEKVASGELYGFIDDLTTIGYQIQKRHLGILKIAGRVDVEWSLGIGVRSDEPMLLKILDKALGSIDEKERQQILNEWVSIKFEKGFDYLLLWKILGGVGILFLMVLYRYQHREKLQLQKNRIELKEMVIERTKDLREERDKLKAAKEALQISEARFRKLFENTDAISVQGYDKERRVIYWNQASERLYGYSAQEAMGKKLEDLIIPDGMREQVIAGIKAWIDERVAVPSLELTLHKADGSPVHVFSSHVLLRSHDGEPEMFCLDIDLTKLRETERELDDKEEMMIAQSRHAAMGEMISMIAHQWRQPLSVIAMGANNMLLDVELDDLQREAVIEHSRSILAQTAHLSATIDDFRDFFRPDQEKEHIFLLSVLEDTKIVIGPSLKSHDIELLIENSSKSTIAVHKRELMQVFINLISNAKDAVISHTQGKKQILISISEESEAFTVTICDNGGGIERSIISKIFDPYFSTKGDLNGTGLGLYMSKTIIEKHLKGHISVSNSDVGACFTVILPKE